MERSRAKRERLHILVDVLSHTGAMTRTDLLTHPDLTAYYGPSADRALRRDLGDLAGRPFESLPGPDESASVDQPPHTHDLRYDRTIDAVSLAPSSAFSALNDDELDLLETLAGVLHADPLLGTRLTKMLTRRGRTAPASSDALTLMTLASNYGEHQGVFGTIAVALREERAVDFVYKESSGEKRYDEFDIVEVGLRDGHYYLYGFNRNGPEQQLRIDYIDPRTFRLNPRYGVKRQHRARPSIEISYWLSSTISARGVSARLHDQHVTESVDGVIVSGKARNLFEAERLLLGYGPLAHALNPPELRAKMAENSRLMARHYHEHK